MKPFIYYEAVLDWCVKNVTGDCSLYLIRNGQWTKEVWIVSFQHDTSEIKLLKPKSLYIY